MNSENGYSLVGFESVGGIQLRYHQYCQYQGRAKLDEKVLALTDVFGFNKGTHHFHVVLDRHQYPSVVGILEKSKARQDLIARPSTVVMRRIRKNVTYFVIE